MFIYTFLISACILGAIRQSVETAPPSERLDDQYDINITLSHRVLEEVRVFRQYTTKNELSGVFTQLTKLVQ